MPRTSTRPHYNATFAVLLLGVGACSLLQSLVVPVLPTLMEHLHTASPPRPG